MENNKVLDNMIKKIAVLAGDGIGPEIMAEAIKVLNVLNSQMNLGLEFENGLIGGAAYDEYGSPFPQQTIDLAAQTIITANGENINFDIDENRKHRLLNGLDDIGLTLQQADEIKNYEKERAKRAPWLFV